MVRTVASLHLLCWATGEKQLENTATLAWGSVAKLAPLTHRRERQHSRLERGKYIASRADVNAEKSSDKLSATRRSAAPRWTPLQSCDSSRYRQWLRCR